MKAVYSLLALATTAVANVLPRGYGGGGGHGGGTETYTTYTTTTICPETQTYTKPGTTYEVTTWITSTIVVTDCYGCEGATVTVPGPTVTGSTVTEVDVTYTTTCPYTETVTGKGTTYYKTYTTTSVYVTKVPTKIIETVPGPAETNYVTDTNYIYSTSYCPITETKTVGARLSLSLGLRPRSSRPRFLSP